MQLLLRRDQKAGLVGIGKVTFALDGHTGTAPFRRRRRCVEDARSGLLASKTNPSGALVQSNRNLECRAITSLNPTGEDKCLQKSVPERHDNYPDN
jgi:hypothetical protein